MRVFKKTICAVIAAGIFTSNIFAGAGQSLIVNAETYSETANYGDYLEYKKVDEDEDGTYDYIEISDCDESATEIIIPSEIDGVSVTSIGKWAFSWCENLISVELPESVTSIGDSAFNWCSKLTNITVPDSVVHIGESAFGGCAFKNITIPDNAVELNVTAFAGCDSLENIYVSGGTQNYLSEDGILFDKDETVLFKYPAGKKYSEYIIPNSVESISSFAFAGSSNLESLIIPDGVKYIGKSAFAASKSFKKVKIPDSVTYIGSASFNMCVNLENVTISEGITSINYDTFFNCRSLKNIIIPNSVISIEARAFFGCNLINIIIPNSVNEIGEQAFSGCSFTSITIPKSVTSIYRAAFSDCINLESVKMETPDCEIYASKETICNKYDEKNNITYYNGIIYGYTDSTAQDYAEKNSYTFESIGEKPIVAILPVTTKPVETATTVQTTTNSMTPSTAIAEVTVPTGVIATKCGDINLDGEINISDVVAINLFMLNQKEYPLEDKAIANADCVKDNVINPSDSTILMNYVAEIIEISELGK